MINLPYFYVDAIENALAKGSNYEDKYYEDTIREDEKHDHLKKLRKFNVNTIFEDNKIIQMDGDDDQLCHLYKNAKVFVFPSKYECLGLPHLEAMSLGCPVISSNHEAILEAVGSAAELFNPNNHEELIHNYNIPIPFL